MSSANMQKTSRLTKWATAWPSWPRQRSDWASEAKVAAARSVSACRVSPGRRSLGIGHRPLELVADGGVEEIVERELVGLADAVGPVGADAEPGHVGDDQEGRVLQGERVLAQLIEGGVEVGVLALVLPGEAVAFPDVGPALAAGVPAGAAFEAVAVAGGSAAAGVGSPRSRQRSMKCSWAAERSLSSEARHLAMNSPGVIAFGSGVGMVVSWVRFCIAGRRCDYTLC